MSDRTAINLTVHHCPDAAVDALFETLDRELGWVSFDTITVHETVQEDEIRCGTVPYLAAKLMEACPGASWELHESPAYEWMGLLCRYTPELGYFSAECDDCASPRFDPREIVKMLTEAGAYVSADWDRQKLTAAMGEAHAEAFREMEAKSEAASPGAPAVLRPRVVAGGE